MKASILDLVFATTTASVAFALWKLHPELADTAVTIGLWLLLVLMSCTRCRAALVYFFVVTTIAFSARFLGHLDMLRSPYFIAEFIDLSLMLCCFVVLVLTATRDRGNPSRDWILGACFAILFLTPFWFSVLPLIPLSIMSILSVGLVLTWSQRPATLQTTEQ